MIKKIFFVFVSVFLFGLLNFSIGEWIFQDVGYPFTVAGQINYTLNARPSGAGIVEGANVIVPAFYVPKRWSSYQYYSLFYYNTDGYMVKNSYQNKASYNSEVYQVVFSNFYLTTPESLSGCTTAFPCGGVSTSYDTYKNNSNFKGQMTRFAYYYSSNSDYESSICLIFDSFDSAFCFYNNQNYVGVNGLTTNPAEFDTSLVGNSPWVSNSLDNNNPVYGDVGNLYGDTIYQTCTNGQALQYMRSKYGYKDVMCYGGLDSFDLYSGDNYTVVPGSGLTVFDMYNYSSGYYNNFVDWFNSYDYIYTSSLGLYGNTNIPLLDNPAVFTTYFDILYNYNVPLGAKDVLSYCDLLLYQDLNGNLLDNFNIGSYIKQEVCKRSVSNNTIIQSGNVVGEDLSGIGDIENVSNSGQVVSGKNIVDGTNFINTYINLLKQNFTIDKNNNVGGVLPGYIVGFLLVILLFRFLRK